MLGATHLPPAVTVPVALLVAAALIVYWIRLGREGVPVGRRRVRRISVTLMVLALPNFVRGLSFVDPAVDRTAYIVSWSITLFAVILVFLTAVIDVLVSVRVQRREYDDELRQVGAALFEALSTHEENAGDTRPPENAE